MFLFDRYCRSDKLVILDNGHNLNALYYFGKKMESMQGALIDMHQKWILCLVFIVLIIGQGPFQLLAAPLEEEQAHPVEQLVGENLSYDISFLWFKHLAEGSIRLERGEQSGTYLAVMEAKTLGVAAFFTRHRVEKYQTLMEIGPAGTLRPLIHSSHTYKGEGDEQKEKLTSYRFDYENRQVRFEKIKYLQSVADELLPLEIDGPVYDILSAFYNLRLGVLGDLDDQTIKIPAFHRKGIEDIIVAPVKKLTGANKKFFSDQKTICKVLVNPSVFKTNGRELFVSFDATQRLEKGVIKNVIGLGDVKGILRPATP